MKVLIVLAAVAVVTLQTVSADGDWGEERGRPIVGGLPSACRCTTTTGALAARFNPCRNNNGTQLTGCFDSNKYIQCVDTACTAFTCPAGQLWNQTSKACYSCADGYHLNAANSSCVCNNGTTLTIVKTTAAGQRPTFTCGPCPTGATQYPDICRCDTPLVLDEGSNSCRACPANSSKHGGECVCNDRTQFWNETSWTCVSCPAGSTFVRGWCVCTDKTQVFNESGWACVGCPTGSVLVTPRRGNTYCNCTGANQIYQEETVSCYTCPAGSTADSDGDECQCPRASNQEFSFKQGGCVCRRGYVAGPTAASACVRATPSTTVKP